MSEAQHPTIVLLNEIGRGGMGVVYRANDTALRRPVAVKAIRDEFRDDPAVVEEFRRGARYQAGLRHDRIVHVYGLDAERGWVVMELLRSNLEEAAGGAPLSHDLARSVLRQGLEALAHLHADGRLHGAVKPTNILIDESGGVKLGDAQGLGPDGEVPVPMGGRKYLAPELCDPAFGPISPGLDLYALGFTVLEALVGPGFAAKLRVSEDSDDPSLAWMRWHGSRDERLPPAASLVPGLPPDLAATLDRMCAKEVAARFSGASEALDSLAKRPLTTFDDAPAAPSQRVVAPSTGGGDPAPVKSGLPLGKLARPGVLVPALALALLLIGGIAYLTNPSEGLEAREVRILVEPADAVVSIDGKPASFDVAKGAAFRAGLRAFRVEKPGYQTIEEEVEVRAGEAPLELRYELTPLDVPLRVASTPPGALVRIDGRELEGRTEGEFAAAPGARTIRVELPGYEPAERAVELTPGAGVETVAFDLKPLPVETRFDVDPPDAAVEIDGRPVDPSSGPIALAPGPRRIKATAEGREPLEETLEVAPSASLLEHRLSLKKLAPAPSPVPTPRPTPEPRPTIEPIDEWEAHAGSVLCLAASADGRDLLTGGADGLVRLWDAHDHRKVSEIDLGFKVYSLALAHDGLLAVAAGESQDLLLLDLKNRRTIRKLETRGTRNWAVSLDESGERALSGGQDKTVWEWRLPNGAPKALRGHDADVLAVGLSADGRRGLSGDQTGRLLLWDLENPGQPRELEGRSGPINRIDVARDGRRALSAGRDGVARLWDLESGRLLQTLEGHEDWVSSARISPDGRRAVTAGYDKALRLWDLETGAELARAVGHTDLIDDVVFLGSHRIASCAKDRDRRVIIWNLGPDAPEAELKMRANR